MWDKIEHYFLLILSLPVAIYYIIKMFICGFLYDDMTIDELMERFGPKND